ncbi:hypothetical protein GCM10028784_22320 [Myceligenerans cantabricum]
MPWDGDHHADDVVAQGSGGTAGRAATQDGVGAADDMATQDGVATMWPGGRYRKKAPRTPAAMTTAQGGTFHMVRAT